MEDINSIISISLNLEQLGISVEEAAKALDKISKALLGAGTTESKSRLEIFDPNIIEPISLSEIIEAITDE